MDKNLGPIARELFGKIRTQFPKIQLGDADSKVTDRPEDARFFEFDFVKNGKNLGTVSASLSNDDGLVVMYSTGMVDNEPSNIKKLWFRFLRELREFARARFLNFDARDIAKSNLEKRDYQQLAKNSGEGTMTESKLWGTSKTSFQDMGEAKLIVKHSRPVNYDIPAGRTMHIESIFVENAEGERFKYPYKHLNGARALATHVAHGGTSYDDIGQHIISLSEELNKLRMFKGYVDRHPMVAEAMDTVNAKVYERIDQIKKEISNLQRPTYYQTFQETFQKKEEKSIPEDLVNDWVDRLTIRTFNEELKNVFPYIYKLVGEDIAPVVEVTADDFVSEEACPTCGMDPCDCDHSKDKDIKEFKDFENYLEDIIGEESSLLSVNDEGQSQAVEKLNQLMSAEFPVGADGTNAIQSLKGIIDDSELIDTFKNLGKVNPEMDVRELVKGFLEKYDEENGTDIATKINFEVPAAAAPQPAAAAPEQPAPAPVAESAFERAIRKAIAAGATEDTKVTLSGKEMSIAEAVVKAGFKVEQFFESKLNNQVVEFVKSMYDETTGRFPKGETGVMLAVEKEFGEDAVDVAKHVVSELSTIYEANTIKKLAGMTKEAVPQPAAKKPAIDPNAAFGTGAPAAPADDGFGMGAPAAAPAPAAAKPGMLDRLKSLAGIGQKPAAAPAMAPVKPVDGFGSTAAAPATQFGDLPGAGTKFGDLPGAGTKFGDLPGAGTKFGDLPPAGGRATAATDPRVVGKKPTAQAPAAKPAAATKPASRSNYDIRNTGF